MPDELALHLPPASAHVIQPAHRFGDQCQTSRPTISSRLTFAIGTGREFRTVADADRGPEVHLPVVMRAQIPRRDGTVLGCVGLAAVKTDGTEGDASACRRSAGIGSGVRCCSWRRARSAAAGRSAAFSGRVRVTPAGIGEHGQIERPDPSGPSRPLVIRGVNVAGDLSIGHAGNGAEVGEAWSARPVTLAYPRWVVRWQACTLVSSS